MTLRIGKIIDISLELDGGQYRMHTPAGFSKDMQFAVEVLKEHDAPGGAGQIVRGVHMRLHAGSHVDAPEHMVKGGKQLQELALETARTGVPVGTIDATVRAFYESKGWKKHYALPGLSHRTGHGIGMDVHEWPYLVRNDNTPLGAGMCFSDEPGIYIPGEFGVRLEDCWHMSEQGPKLFTPLAKSIDAPV